MTRRTVADERRAASLCGERAPGESKAKVNLNSAATVLSVFLWTQSWTFSFKLRDLLTVYHTCACSVSLRSQSVFIFMAFKDFVHVLDFLRFFLFSRLSLFNRFS